MRYFATNHGRIFELRERGSIYMPNRTVWVWCCEDGTFMDSQGNLLKEQGGGNFASPEGLRYTLDSARHKGIMVWEEPCEEWDDHQI